MPRHIALGSAQLYTFAVVLLIVTIEDFPANCTRAAAQEGGA